MSGIAAYAREVPQYDLDIIADRADTFGFPGSGALDLRRSLGFAVVQVAYDARLSNDFVLWGRGHLKPTGIGMSRSSRIRAMMRD